MSGPRVLKAQSFTESDTRTTALDDLEYAMREAHAAGVSEGHEEGARQAQLEIQQGPLADLSAQMTELLKRSEVEHRDALRLDAETIVDLSMTVARWVIGEAAKQPETLGQLLTDMVLEAADTDPISVRVSPEAALLLQKSFSGDLRIVPDRSLGAGDLVLDTTGARLEMVVEEALCRAREILLDSSGRPS